MIVQNVAETLQIFKMIRCINKVKVSCNRFFKLARGGESLWSVRGGKYMSYGVASMSFVYNLC